MDISAPMAYIMAPKEESELAITKKACQATMDLFKKRLQEQIEGIIDSEKVRPCLTTVSSAGAGGGGCMDTASHPCHVALISTKPLFQFIWCSTYWIQVLIPRLHQFSESSGKYSGHCGHLKPFLVKLGTCHPDIYQTAFSILFVFNILDENINS